MTSRRGYVRGRHGSPGLSATSGSKSASCSPAPCIESGADRNRRSQSRAISPRAGADFYEIEPSADGRLIAQTAALSAGLELRLSLYDGQGNLLVAE